MTSAPLRLAGGFATTREAEHAHLDADFPLLATVFDPVEQVVVLGAVTAEELPERARLFAFPGHEQLTGSRTVEHMLGTTAIDEIRGLAALPVGPTDVVATQAFVRPTVESGRVVLVLRPYDDGSDVVGRAAWVPFEQPNPTPCCADH